MPTQYLFVAALVVAALSAWGGYSHGIDVERGRQAVGQEAAVNAAVAAAHLDAQTETQRRQDAALRDARRAASAREIKLKGQIDALRNSRPECAMPDSRRVLINAAVDVANGAEADSPHRLPDAMPVAASPR